jgi:hypothetical protein
MYNPFRTINAAQSFWSYRRLVAYGFFPGPDQKGLAGATGLEPATSCVTGGSMVERAAVNRKLHGLLHPMSGPAHAFPIAKYDDRAVLRVTKEWRDVSCPEQFARIGN